MKKVVKLTENDLIRIVKRVINEQDEPFDNDYFSNKIGNEKLKVKSRDDMYMYEREMGRIKSALYDIKRSAANNDLEKVNYIVDSILMSLEELNKSKNF